MKNINIYIENNTNNLWVRRNDAVYILSRDEINGIISVFIDEKKTNGPSEFSDLFDFNEILFDEKPGEEIRNLLKSRAFRWSPKNNAWQRILSNEAIYITKLILKDDLLKEKKEF